MVWPTHDRQARPPGPVADPSAQGRGGGFRRPPADGLGQAVSTLVLIVVGLAALAAWSVVGH